MVSARQAWRGLGVLQERARGVYEHGQVQSATQFGECHQEGAAERQRQEGAASQGGGDYADNIGDDREQEKKAYIQ